MPFPQPIPGTKGRARTPRRDRGTLRFRLRWSPRHGSAQSADSGGDGAAASDLAPKNQCPFRVMVKLSDLALVQKLDVTMLVVNKFPTQWAFFPVGEPTPFRKLGFVVVEPPSRRRSRHHGVF